MVNGTRNRPSAQSDKVQRALCLAGQDCRQIGEHLDMRYFHLVLRLIVAPGTPVQAFVDGGPAGFAQAYAERLGTGRDPLLHRAIQEWQPFEWNVFQAEADRALAPLYEVFGSLGLREGFAIPLHGPHGATGMLSFASNTPMHGSRALRQEMMRHAQWGALGVLERLSETLRTESERCSGSSLTERQYQALSLAARGQALNQIGATLGVRSSTVRYLIARAAEKLGVASREEAIVRLTALEKLTVELFPTSLPASTIRYAAPQLPTAGQEVANLGQARTGT